MQIELNEDEYTGLLIVLGYATGAAFKEGNRQFAYFALHLANRINRGGGHWMPYQIPDEFKEAFDNGTYVVPKKTS